MNTFKKTGGFTLVELIIVIAILAILSSVAVAGYSSYIKRANNSAVLSELNNISTAATLANAEAGGIKEIVIKADGTFTIEADSSFDDEFPNLFEKSTGIPVTDSDSDGKYEGTLTSKNWSNSKYSENGVSTTWNGTWGEPKK